MFSFLVYVNIYFLFSFSAAEFIARINFFYDKTSCFSIFHVRNRPMKLNIRSTLTIEDLCLCNMIYALPAPNLINSGFQQEWNRCLI